MFSQFSTPCFSFTIQEKSGWGVALISTLNLGYQSQSVSGYGQNSSIAGKRLNLKTDLLFSFPVKCNNSDTSSVHIFYDNSLMCNPCNVFNVILLTYISLFLHCHTPVRIGRGKANLVDPGETSCLFFLD